MEFKKLSEDRYLVVGSNNRIVTKKEKNKLEKKELVLKDINSSNCQSETTKKIKEIEKNASDEAIEETASTAE